MLVFFHLSSLSLQRFYARLIALRGVGSKFARYNIESMFKGFIMKNNLEWAVEVHQLDVGQGDSALILFKHEGQIHKSILLDGGYGYHLLDTKRYILDKIGNENRLSAVIKTHEDADHINGLPTVQDIDVVNQQTRFFGYVNVNVGQSIWTLLGQGKPDDAPEMLCVSSNGNVLTTASASTFLGSTDENNRSLGFVIKHGHFRFFTAGDLKSSHEDRIFFDKALSIFKASHHGSKDHTSESFLTNNAPRATVISHGNRKFGNARDHHPNRDTLSRLNNSNHLMFAYLTNPCAKELENLSLIPPNKQRFIEQNKKFVVAGHATTLLESGVAKDPKGHVVIKTSKTQAEHDKFTVEYQQPGRKVRDYFKDSKFSRQQNKILKAIEPLTITESVDGSEKCELLLTEKQLKFFKEADKLKHLNPQTIQKAIDGCSSQKQLKKKQHNRKQQPIYRLSIFNTQNQVSLELKSVSETKALIKKEYHQGHGDTQVAKRIEFSG